VRLVADAGRVVIVVVTSEKFSLRGVDLTKKELAIFGSRNNLDNFSKAIEYISKYLDIAKT